MRFAFGIDKKMLKAYAHVEIVVVSFVVELYLVFYSYLFRAAQPAHVIHVFFYFHPLPSYTYSDP